MAAGQRRKEATVAREFTRLFDAEEATESANTPKLLHARQTRPEKESFLADPGVAIKQRSQARVVVI